MFIQRWVIAGTFITALLCIVIAKEFAPLLIVPATLGSFLLLNLIHVSMRAGATVFHPVPIVSIILIWAMVFSPFVSIGTGHYMNMAPKRIDFEYWTILIAYVYLGCIIFYYVGCRTGRRNWHHSVERIVIKRRLYFLAPLFLVVTLALQLYVYGKMGGVWGYMQSWTEDRSQFAGLGLVFTVAEAFPMIALVTFFCLIKGKSLRQPLLILGLVFIVFFLLKLFFGGFRGSRSNTVWGLLWFAGIVHLFIYRLKFIHFVVGLVFVMSYMSIYSFYKSFGVEAFQQEYSFEDTGRFGEVSPLLSIAQGDFARTSVHALLLHEYFDRTDYDLKYGRTYINTVIGFIPFAKTPFTPDTKDSAGAELFYGKSIDPETSFIHNSRIYGLYGEGLMNFGPILPIFLFLFAGVAIGRLDGFFSSLEPGDVRGMLVPLVSNASFIMLLSDANNFLFFLVKNGLLVVTFVYLISISVEKPKLTTAFNMSREMPR